MLHTTVSVPLVYVICMIVLFIVTVIAAVRRTGWESLNIGHCVLVVSAIFQALLGWGTAVILVWLALALVIGVAIGIKRRIH